MFALRETFIKIDNEQVGFMQGFRWERATAIQHDSFSQFWHGKRQDKQPVFRALHRGIELTRDFPEHYWIQLYQFVMSIFVFITSIFSIIKLIVELSSTDGDGPSLAIPIIGGILSVIGFFLGRAGPIIQCVGQKRLREKICQTIQNVNLGYLVPLGYHAEFPEKSSKFCFFIMCCDCCFRKKDWSRIEIFDSSQPRVEESLIAFDI